MPPGIVTLLTDFGTLDTYVGQMKGVMLGIDPTLRLVDLTHDIPPQNVSEGAFQLATAVEVFPPETVHLAVVDPGVGTSRRAIVVRTSVGTFVGPDNGLFSFVYEHGVVCAYELRSGSLPRRTVSSTFHGRDLFAPAAAAIASNAIELEDAGAELDPATLVRLDLSSVQVGDGEIRGSIVSIDRFGNCLTLIRPEHLSVGSDIMAIECNGFRADRLNGTYADLDPGSPIALFGSFGTLELSERDGNAAKRWSIRRGDAVRVRLKSVHRSAGGSRILPG